MGSGECHCEHQCYGCADVGYATWVMAVLGKKEALTLVDRAAARSGHRLLF